MILSMRCLLCDRKEYYTPMRIFNYIDIEYEEYFQVCNRAKISLLNENGSVVDECSFYTGDNIIRLDRLEMFKTILQSLNTQFFDVLNSSNTAELYHLSKHVYEIMDKLSYTCGDSDINHIIDIRSTLKNFIANQKYCDCYPFDIDQIILIAVDAMLIDYIKHNIQIIACDHNYTIGYTASNTKYQSYFRMRELVVYSNDYTEINVFNCYRTEDGPRNLDICYCLIEPVLKYYNDHKSEEKFNFDDYLKYFSTITKSCHYESLDGAIERLNKDVQTKRILIMALQEDRNSAIWDKYKDLFKRFI